MHAEAIGGPAILTNREAVESRRAIAAKQQQHFRRRGSHFDPDQNVVDPEVIGYSSMANLVAFCWKLASVFSLTDAQREQVRKDSDKQRSAYKHETQLHGVRSCVRPSQRNSVRKFQATIGQLAELLFRYQNFTSADIAIATQSAN